MTTPNVPPVTRVDTSAIDDPNKQTAEPTLPSETPPSEEKLLAGKFKSPEELERGYQELVKLLGKQGKVTADGEPSTQATQTDPLKIDPTEASKVVSDAGLDMEQFNKEFAETGQLSEGSYEKLTKAGIPKEVVDGYIAGQVALAEAAVSRVHSWAGGSDSYAQMIAWAATGLDAGSIAAYNKEFSGSQDEQKFAVESLAAKYKAAQGSDPKLLKGGGPISAPAGYASRAEMVQDMKDPRYQTDSAYRARVQAKVAQTSAF